MYCHKFPNMIHKRVDVWCNMTPLINADEIFTPFSGLFKFCNTGSGQFRSWFRYNTIEMEQFFP